MNTTSISKKELNLIIRAVTELHRVLESNEKAGTDEYRSLRELEDKLGSLSGTKFKLMEAIE